MQPSKNHNLRALCYIFLGLVMWVLGCAAPNRNNPKPAVSSGQPASSPASQPGKPENWAYDEEPDKMGRGTVKRAWTTSLNKVDFDFPYAGEQYARLTLRTHPEYGKDVILSIDRGQFLCRFDGCSVLVRFDEGKAERYSAAEPADHSTTTLFISGFDKLVANAKRSKKAMIEAQFYQEGARVFEFAVEGLEWGAAKQAKGK